LYLPERKTLAKYRVLEIRAYCQLVLLRTKNAKHLVFTPAHSLYDFASFLCIYCQGNIIFVYRNLLLLMSVFFKIFCASYAYAETNQNARYLTR